MTKYPNSLELMTACHELAEGSKQGLSEPAELVRGCLQTMTSQEGSVEEKADRLYQRLRKLSKLDWGLVVATCRALQLAPTETAKEGAAT